MNNQITGLALVQAKLVAAQAAHERAVPYLIEEALSALDEFVRSQVAAPSQPEGAEEPVARVDRRNNDLKAHWEDKDEAHKLEHGTPLYLHPSQSAGAAASKRCEHCDDTGDVHSIDGEWRGRCTCAAGAAAPDERKAKACSHEWVDARNKYIKSGELCVKCFAMRAGNRLSAPKGEAATPSSQGGQHG
jgi:hypothetical protein